MSISQEPWYQVGDRVRVIRRLAAVRAGEEGRITTIHRDRAGEVRALTIVLDGGPSARATTVFPHEVELVLKETAWGAGL